MRHKGSARCATVCSLVVLAAGALGAAIPVQAGEFVRYRRTAIMDPEVNAPAVWMLVPEGWTFDSAVVWNMQRPACPATVGAYAADPESGAHFQLLPSQFFGWNIALNQPYYFGYELLPSPQNPFQLFDDYILPRARTSIGCTNLRVLDRTTISAETDALGGTHIWVSVQVDYDFDGITWDEILYGYFTYTPDGRFVSCENLACFAAPEGSLDEYLPTLNTIANSVHVAPGWYTGFRTVSNQLIQGVFDQIAAIGRWSAQFAREMDELSDAQFRAWQDRNAAEDRAFQKWSNAFRGVDTYVDGGAHVDLDNTHDAWWTNGLGEYIGADGHVDPNDWGLNQNWTRLQRVD